jgi:hypothetical protein
VDIQDFSSKGLRKSHLLYRRVLPPASHFTASNGALKHARARTNWTESIDRYSLVVIDYSRDRTNNGEASDFHFSTPGLASCLIETMFGL